MNNIKIFEEDLPPDIDLSNEKVIGIDNEALGLVLGRDPLTLVQLGLESKKFYLIKLNRETYKAPNLVKVLSNPSTEFVMHYARQDLMWLKYHLKVEPKNIFCTKIASKLARTYTNKHGLKDLINELLGIELDKSSQSSDWGSNEDLTEDQLDYAANDVKYLIEAMHKLKVILRRENRYELAKKCFKTISLYADLDILRFSNIFEH